MQRKGLGERRSGGGRRADTCSGPLHKKLANNGEQASRDLSAAAAVRAALFSRAAFAHPRRTERPYRPCFVIRASRKTLKAALPTRAARASSCQPSHALRLPGGEKCSLRRTRMGVISPPRCFSAGPGCPRRAGASATASAAETGSRSPCFPPPFRHAMAVAAEKKTEGLQCLKATFLVGLPRELLPLRRQPDPFPALDHQ